MGQEAGKPAWLKPAGGFQTIIGRRYGRRHACVVFRRSLNSQDRDEHQHEDCERLEWEDVQRENSLRSSPSVLFSPDLLDEPVLENIATGEPISQSVSSQALEVNVSDGLEGNSISGNTMNLHENSEDLTEYASGGQNDLNGQNEIAFVNIDSYEPDSSDGEEDDAQDKFALAREADGVFQGTLDNMFSELEESMKSFTDLEFQLSTLNHSVSTECFEEAGPMPLMRNFSIDSGLACPDNETVNSSTEDQAILQSNLSGANWETQQIENAVDVGIRTPIAIASNLNVSGDQENSPELVVRPKIRKPNNANQLEREEFLPEDNEEERGSWRRNEVEEIQQDHAEHVLENSRDISSSVFFDSREYEGHQRNTGVILRTNAAGQEQNEVVDNSTLCDFEVCNRHSSMSHNDENSSEWSDGEWSTAVPTCFTPTEEESSSDGSWETVPAREPEVQSSSSGLKDENIDVCCQGGEQTILEEGEIPWLQYQDEVESSSDEEDDAVSDFMHSAFFLLDGNNNLEDDSSVSEDLDVDWRILDESGDDLGLAQAIPYMDPQFLAFMAIEGRLQQAMELLVLTTSKRTELQKQLTPSIAPKQDDLCTEGKTAMAHLESLGFAVEQAYPPATQETIDCLPQIIITDDHEGVGQEQCCTICCSEYVKGEIITELPCHHLFHRPCVTLWLQNSGTCPVCRHVLAPMPPEAADATDSFLSDHDLTSSVHNDTGTSN